MCPRPRPRPSGAAGLIPLRHSVLTVVSLACLGGGDCALWAGDILRGGAPAHPRSAPQAGGTAPVQAAQARANARDALARTTRAVQASERMQQVARAAAARAAATPLRNPAVPGAFLPAVPNGLGAGGLQLAGPPVGALNPVQSGAGGAAPARVTVKQTAQQALLNWSSFNVGAKTNLRFDQSAGGANKNQWIAFNRVTDPTGQPSQILGSIHADGQVYVINQNGVIFGGASQVNAHTLVAASLPINENLINRGLLNQSTTAQFLFSGLPQAGDVPFTPPAPPPGGKYGDVTVLAGATLTAPTTEANVGGRVALVGANVRNQGTIATPDGQTILAAGLQVGFAAHSASDPSLRGLDAFVGDVGDYAGAAANEGLIQAPRGSVAITGKSVAQLGAIDSSTSVSLNGRIDLRAEFGATANQKFDPVFSSTSPPFLFGGQGAVQEHRPGHDRQFECHADSARVGQPGQGDRDRTGVEVAGERSGEDRAFRARGADAGTERIGERRDRGLGFGCAAEPHRLCAEHRPDLPRK